LEAEITIPDLIAYQVGTLTLAPDDVVLLMLKEPCSEDRARWIRHQVEDRIDHTVLVVSEGIEVGVIKRLAA
jgi:hypothetical protein